MRRRARGERERQPRGRNGATGTWILPVALGVFLSICLIFELPDGDPTLVKPIYQLEEGVLQGDYRLDINSATAQELSYLEGIGEVLAARIVQWREENGAFESIEQLMEVEGIGKGRLETIRDLIRAGE